jgi:hypothetical protein
MLILAACGGGADVETATREPGGGVAAPTSAGDDSSGGGSGDSGAVVNPQPAGQAAASVDGQDLTFNTPGGIACKVSADEFSFSYIIGDNEITMGGGASIQGGQWFGSLSMRMTSDEGTTEYVAKLNDNPGGVAIDGSSVSYSGPMEKFLPAPPGELPEPIEVGDGVFSATCG